VPSRWPAPPRYADHRLGTFPLLNIVIQRRDFHRQLRLRLMDALTINTIVNLHQQVAFLPWRNPEHSPR
jgi:hypothetical protein